MMRRGGTAAANVGTVIGGADKDDMKIINVVGARPNLIKMAPIVAELSKYPDLFTQALIHTGQHYDERMGRLLFQQLGLPQPDINLGVGSGSHGAQTGRIMAMFEEVCQREKPDLVIVVGDVNSTMACAITAKKLRYPSGACRSGSAFARYEYARRDQPALHRCFVRILVHHGSLCE